MTSSSSGCKAGERKYLLPVAVDIGLRGLARRLGVEFLFKKRENHFVWWHSIQHLEEKTANLKLVSDRAQLDKLHPADLADILEDLDYKKRTDFIEDLDVETAAEAFAEMEADTQIEILEHLGSQQAADLLEEMPPDEAADLLGELPEEKADELLNLMEPEEAQEVRELMEHEEGTAGALMTTEFIALPPDLTVAEAFPELRKQAAEAETIYYLYILGEGETLLGVVSLRELLIAEPEAKLAGPDADPDHLGAARGSGRAGDGAHRQIRPPGHSGGGGERQDAGHHHGGRRPGNAHSGPGQPGDLRQFLHQQTRHEMRRLNEI